MKKIAFVSMMVFSGLMVACSTAEEPTESATTAAMPEIEIVTVSGEGNTIADFSVAGMSCEMNCVSSVKGTLADIDGVFNIDFPEFSGENEVNHGFVEFDADKVSPEDMVAAIQELYEGTYTVKHVKVEQHNGEAAPVEETTPVEEEQAAPVSTSVETSTSFQMPNLLDLVKGLF